MNGEWQIWGMLILMVVVIAGAAILPQYFLRKAQRRAWGELASQLGLTFDPSRSIWLAPLVTGTYRGHALELDTFLRGTNKNRRNYTRIVVTVNNPADLRLELHEEGLASQVVKLLGAQDLRVEDEAFDRRFRIKGQPEAVVRRLLDSGAFRQQLLAVPVLNLTLEGNAIRYEHPGVEKGIERLRSLFDLLTELATRVEQL